MTKDYVEITKWRFILTNYYFDKTISISRNINSLKTESLFRNKLLDKTNDINSNLPIYSVLTSAVYKLHSIVQYTAQCIWFGMHTCNTNLHAKNLRKNGHKKNGHCKQRIVQNVKQTVFTKKVMERINDSSYLKCMTTYICLKVRCMQYGLHE